MEILIEAFLWQCGRNHDNLLDFFLLSLLSIEPVFAPNRDLYFEFLFPSQEMLRIFAPQLGTH